MAQYNSCMNVIVTLRCVIYLSVCRAADGESGGGETGNANVLQGPN